MMRKKLFSIFSLLVLISMIAAPVGAQAPAPSAPAADVSRLQLREDGPTVTGFVSGSKGTDYYTVIFAEPSVALNHAGVNGLAATSLEATGGRKLDVTSAAVQAYAGYLKAQHAAFLDSASASIGRALTAHRQFVFALNGLTLKLTAAEAAAVSKLPGVKQVLAAQADMIDTDTGPQLIGAPAIWDGSATGGLPGTKGEGIIIGVLDSGINMDHPSFAEVGGDGYVHTNPFGADTFIGWCDSTNPNYDPAYVCNDKLIGAWDYADDSWTGDGFEDDGPEDNAGHGSHTASTSGGNQVDAAIDFGSNVITTTISGVAPHANLIAYDVCGATGSCYDFDVAAGIEQSILDGVDVLNESIGIGGDPYNGLKQSAYLSAYAAGIASSRSAGNSGPNPGTVGPEPLWSMSSANSSHSTVYANTFDVTGPGTIDPSLTDLAALQGVGPAVTTDISAEIRYDATNATGCVAFTADYFAGAIALIQRGGCTFAVKVTNATTAGAIAVVVFNNAGGPPFVMGGIEASTVPSVMLSNLNGNAVRDFVVANPGATGTIFADVAKVNDPAWQDILNSTSSRGPHPLDVVKPDVAAPGTNILAAVATTPGSTPPEYDFYSGTSMASPHTAGSLALLTDLYPTWSPAQMRSALMTTAYTGLLKENAVTPATPFDQGAGRLDLTKAAEAGLVLDVTAEEFEDSNPALGGDPRELNLASMQTSACYQDCSWTRYVTNPTATAMDWDFTDYSGAGMGSVSPDSFSIDPGETITLTFTIDSVGLPTGGWQYGWFMFAESGDLAPDAHFPAAFIPVDSTNDQVLVKEADVTEAAEGQIITYTMTLANDQVVTDTFTLEDTLPANLEYISGTATGGLTYDDGTNTLSWSGDLGGSGFELIPYAGTYLPMSAFVPPATKPSNADDGALLISGLSVEYFGTAYTQAIWSVNGVLQLGTAGSAAAPASNTALPNAAGPNNIIAGWWTDLDLTSAGNWYLAGLTDGVNDYTIFEWTDVPRFGDPSSTITFQIWMVDGTDFIWISYPDGAATGDTADATVGAENSTGTVGDMYYFNGVGTVPNDVDLELTLAISAPKVFTFQAEVMTEDLDFVNEAVATSLNEGETSAYALVEGLSNPRLQVAHLAPFAVGAASAVTVTLNGDVALTGFEYGDSTAYIELPVGTYDVEIFAGSAITPAISATVDLLPDTYYTAIAVGDGVNQPLELLALVDDVASPASGNFKLRLGHLAPFASVITDTLADVRLDDGTLILDDVPFGAVAPYLELPAGEYDLKITTPDGYTTLINLAPVTFTDGQIVSAFAVGNGTIADLGGYALPSDATGFFLPLEYVFYLPVMMKVAIPSVEP